MIGKELSQRTKDRIGIQPMTPPTGEIFHFTKLDFPDHFSEKINFSEIQLDKKYQCLKAYDSEFVGIYLDEGLKFYTNNDYLQLIKDNKEKNQDMYKFIFEENAEYLI